jgi:hypothetical protein
MNQHRYAAYRSFLFELGELRSRSALTPESFDELRDAAEGLLLARDDMEGEDSLARASTTVLGMLALDDLDEHRASLILDMLLACGPRFAPASAAA